MQLKVYIVKNFGEYKPCILSSTILIIFSAAPGDPYGLRMDLNFVENLGRKVFECAINFYVVVLCINNTWSSWSSLLPVSNVYSAGV